MPETETSEPETTGCEPMRSAGELAQTEAELCLGGYQLSDEDAYENPLNYPRQLIETMRTLVEEIIKLPQSPAIELAAATIDHVANVLEYENDR
jgi:histidinol-phosphate/aromatic aminotransferase/cobyric acid decarboxylase-like protein